MKSGLVTLVILALAAPAACFRSVAVRAKPLRSASASRSAVQMIDMETLIGAGVLLGSIGGGVALIAFTEGAGKREAANAQVCVDCNGEKTVICTLCQGTGVDPFANLVAGVKEMAGDTAEAGGTTKVEVDDWEAGTKVVDMYADILEAFPVKATENVCLNCGGRGVVICDNCAPIPSTRRAKRSPLSHARLLTAQARVPASSRASWSVLARTTSWTSQVCLRSRCRASSHPWGDTSSLFYVLIRLHCFGGLVCAGCIARPLYQSMCLLESSPPLRRPRRKPPLA